MERIHLFDLVEPMQCLFIKIVKLRGLAHDGSSYVKIGMWTHYVRSKSAIHWLGEPTHSPGWHQFFALSRNKPSRGSFKLKIFVWDSLSRAFLSGVCFDLSN
ncbi:hypothetical protein EUGRSUZ_E04119 [Eucalyptus grandis]|uniref:Uncharacterized protein n=2 Tax=Eucalyptus grandis TaxID=71139 RepID=A0ACC3KZU3_EUCGR|nr:hypothetical protein EUGRSUZ_E04119 [Eucalyptus grandis]